MTDHRGTARPHVEAIVTELARVELPSGRTLIFEHAVFGSGHALDVVALTADGKRFNVRVPAGVLLALRQAIRAVEARASAPPPRPGAASLPASKPARVPPLPPTARHTNLTKGTRPCRPLPTE